LGATSTRKRPRIDRGGRDEIPERGKTQNHTFATIASGDSRNAMGCPGEGFKTRGLYYSCRRLER